MLADEVVDEGSVKETARELLKQGRSVRLKLDGMSMYPILRPGDVALVEPLSEAIPEVGTVLVFECENRWLAHRLVAVQENDFLHQGDSVRRSDAPVPRAMVLGRIEMVNRKGKVQPINRGWRSLLGRLMVSLRPLPQWAVRLLVRAFRSLIRGWHST